MKKQTEKGLQKSKKINKTDAKNSFLSGVLILTASTILVKLAGMFFKIPMNYIVGDTGMGYYNSAYSIYTLFYMISTSGLPVAITVMVSEKRAEGDIVGAKKVFRLSLLSFAVIGFVFSAVMIVFSDSLTALMGSCDSRAALLTAAPTVFLICVASAYRGYFQGSGNMFPTAVSQLIEALGKLVFGVGAGIYAVNCLFPTHITAAYAVSGLTIGSFFGMIYLILTKFFRGDRDLLVPKNSDIPKKSEKKVQKSALGTIFKRIVKISIPVTLSASVMSLTSLIDAAMIQRSLLASGFTAESAAAVYGNYTSLAVPMFNLPPTLVYPIAYALTPIVAASFSGGNITEEARDKINSSLKYALILTLPCAMGLSTLSEPILKLLYKDASASLAAPLLTILSPSSVLVALTAITNSALQGAAKEKIPLISMLSGSAVKIFSASLLLKKYGIYGAPISTFLCYLTVSAVNLAFTARYTKAYITPKTLVKPLIGSVLSSFAASFLNDILTPLIGGSASCLVSILSAAAVYFAFIVLSGEAELNGLLRMIKNKGLNKNERKKSR